MIHEFLCCFRKTYSKIPFVLSHSLSSRPLLHLRLLLTNKNVFKFTNLFSYMTSHLFQWKILNFLAFCIILLIS